MLFRSLMRAFTFLAPLLLLIRRRHQLQPVRLASQPTQRAKANCSTPTALNGSLWRSVNRITSGLRAALFLRKLQMAVIYLRHPDHGVKVACMDLEADADEENGWERFDPDDDIQRVRSDMRSVEAPRSVSRRRNALVRDSE